jgi:hypothetical protein
VGVAEGGNAAQLVCESSIKPRHILTQSLYSMEQASSWRLLIRPLVRNVMISRLIIHFLHLELEVIWPSGPLSLLSIMTFLRLARCRRNAPRKIASTVTEDVYVRPSCKNSTSSVFGASVSLRKEINEVETVFVWMRLMLRA